MDCGKGNRSVPILKRSTNSKCQCPSRPGAPVFDLFQYAGRDSSHETLPFATPKAAKRTKHIETIGSAASIHVFCEESVERISCRQLNVIDIVAFVITVVAVRPQTTPVHPPLWNVMSKTQGIGSPHVKLKAAINAEKGVGNTGIFHT